jgi:hypothetical protein
MKSHRIPSFFLLLGFLLSFVAVSERNLSAIPPETSQNSSAKASRSSGPPVSVASTPALEATIPGPLRSFLRMAAISQKISPEEVLPLLARNVVVSGYQGGKPTEFLVLLNWYMDQARELEALAGPGGVIRVSGCDTAKPLLTILGYRLRQSCGPDAALETADANRAFLTIDSGFPLADLEEALRTNQPFETPYAATKVPVLFNAPDWVQNKANANRGVVDSILRDPQMARLYWAMSRMDTETAQFLWQSLGQKKLLVDAAVLDFYGSEISVRSGRVLTPGGAAGESAWKDLVGASPRSPVDFVSKLLARDNGWLAAYFDSLSRVDQTQQAYFGSPRHLQRFYDALRGRDITPPPTKHSFRPDQGLFLLMTRLQLDPNGQPHIPGSIEVWKDVMRRKTDSKLVREWGQKAGGWNNPDQVVEGIIGVSRYPLREGPLNVFLALSEIDRRRPPSERLGVPAARMLADKFSVLGDQYPTFAEFHALNDASITRFLTVAESLDQIPDRLVRTDALGVLQANLGLWQILARQGQIPDSNTNDSWQKVVNAFGSLRTSAQVYDAGRTALGEILRSATGKPVLPQDQVLALLAGPEQASREGQQMRSEMATRMRQVMDDQRLISLDTLIVLGDGLNRMAKGNEMGDSLLPFAGELREFELPRPLFTNRERTEYAAGLYSNRHTALQMRTDLIKVIKGPSSPEELGEARGLLAPFLRDTLVGLNYSYYEPPGAQMLHNNPLFVRSHDFSGGEYSGEAATANEQIWRSPRLFGRGWTASGGAHLIGSMADLPYALAKVEQDFIVPQNVQSLIWEDLVPGLITSAVLTRWWNVTPNELHAVALYQRAGEDLLAAATHEEKLRQPVVSILSDRMLPLRSEQLELALRSGEEDRCLGIVAPAESFYLAAEFRRRNPKDVESLGPAGKELEDLLARSASETSLERISADFGVPHPALAQSYGRELMNLKPIPTFLDYSSRLLAESWDSSNLYWARLADEMGYSPVLLNRIVPQLTRRMVEQTFASHLEDWPAVLRAMRETGEEFRHGKIAALPKSGSAGL